MRNNMQNDITLKGLASLIDHSLLHPTVTDEEIRQGCNLAKKYGTATVCIKPYCIPMVRDLLAESSVKICPVISFPHGNSSTNIKVQEAKEATMQGGHEIDMVINVGKVLGGDWNYVKAEIKAINDAVTSEKAILKVIFENDFLQDSHIIHLCKLCSECHVAFIKTSTGYGFVKQSHGTYAAKGATEHHLSLMRKHADPSVQIKAAGGIRNLDALLRAKALGATRIGTTATESILEEAKTRGIA